ncbi:MAG: hypothetical protein LCI00_19190 [Chloroflexi bacterium]|nr:hypothetical protein [Chloroflexota bacterium]
MKKGIWALVTEYFLAAPILGIPCYAVVPVWASKNGMAAIGPIILAFFYVGLAIYQLKRVSVLGSGKDTKLPVFLGAISIVISLFFLLSFVQTFSSFSVSGESMGTGDPVIISGVTSILSSLGFGFLLGFGILFLGYARLEYIASQKSDSIKAEN